MIKVSVIIPNYNGKNYLKACIDSVRAQEGVSFEMIIIDNASQDSTYNWISSYPDVIFKRLNQNYGFSKAVNEGIHLAQGDYVLLLNNDTVLEKDFLREIVKTIEEDEKIFGVSSKMIAYQNRAIMDDAGDEYTLLGWTLKRGDGKKVEHYEKPCKVFSACAGAALYRREVFKKIGEFDEQFFAYMEDVDISYRARIYGYYNVYCPKAKVYHIGSATSGSKYNEFKVKLAARNNIYVPYKNMPFAQIIINFPFLISGIAIKWVWFAKKGFGKAYQEGIVEGLRKCRTLRKIPFKVENSLNYVRIEILLVINIFRYVVEKLKK